MNTIKSDLGWSTRERIVVRGKDLPGEILGTLNLGDMAFLELTGRVPNPRESRLFNAMAVTLVEHGVTPSALAARMTYDYLLKSGVKIYEYCDRPLHGKGESAMIAKFLDRDWAPWTPLAMTALVIVAGAVVAFW